MEDHYANLGLSDRFTKAELGAKWDAAQTKHTEAGKAYSFVRDLDFKDFEEYREDYAHYRSYFEALGLTGDEDDMENAIRNQYGAVKESYSKARDAYKVLSDPAQRKDYDKQRKEYLKQTENIWLGGVMQSLKDESPKPSKKNGEAEQHKSSIELDPPPLVRESSPLPTPSLEKAEKDEEKKVPKKSSIELAPPHTRKSSPLPTHSALEKVKKDQKKKGAAASKTCTPKKQAPVWMKGREDTERKENTDADDDDDDDDDDDFDLNYERSRLDELLLDFKANLTTLSHLNDLFSFKDERALEDYGFNADKLKSLITNIEGFNAGFKGIFQNVEILSEVFDSLQPEESSPEFGDFRNIKYRLHKRQHLSATFDYHKGTILYEDGVKSNACFLRSKKQQKDACVIHKLNEDVNITRLCKPGLYFKHKGDPLLSYHSFSSLAENAEHVRKLRQPRNGARIIGYPNKSTQTEIKGIIEGVIEMQKAERMCCSLDDEHSFVSTTEKGRGMNIKILELDKYQKSITDSDLSRLQKGLDKVCLKEDDNVADGHKKEDNKLWEKYKSRFLEAFVNKRVEVNVRLEMLLYYPFLKSETYFEVLCFFTDLYLAIKAKAPFRNRDVWNFRLHLKKDITWSKYLINGKWSRQKTIAVGEGVDDRKNVEKMDDIDSEKVEPWCDGFQRVFDYKSTKSKNLPNSIKEKFSDPSEGVVESEFEDEFTYDEGDMLHLIKFIRNAVVHHCNRIGGMSAREIFDGINLCWPGLIELCHELLFAKV